MYEKNNFLILYLFNKNLHIETYSCVNIILILRDAERRWKRCV